MPRGCASSHRIVPRRSLTSEVTIPGSQFEAVQSDLQREIPDASGGFAAVVVRSQDGDALDAKQRAAIRRVFATWKKEDEVADVIEDVVAAYIELRERPNELFVETVKRLGVEPFKERVYAAR